MDHNMVLDLVIPTVLLVISYLTKAVLRPNEFEMRVAVRFLAGFTAIFLTWFKKHPEHIPHFENILNELSILRKKLKRDKIKLG